MALFEGYERRIAQIDSYLAAAGIESLEKAEKICLDKNVDVRKIVKSIQNISFENAGWAYLIGAAVAIKKKQTLAAEIAETLNRQRQAMHTRLFPEMPGHPFICFYPMDRRRGEHKNWYQVPLLERQRMMSDHGAIGRRYAGTVKQIISGSIGFDDWEWGVDLFAEDPVVFNKLIYEMRFDEVSAIYALFGAFYVGMRTPAADIGKLLAV